MRVASLFKRVLGLGAVSAVGGQRRGCRVAGASRGGGRGGPPAASGEPEDVLLRLWPALHVGV